MSEENIIPEELIESEVVNLTETGAETIQAEQVRMQQSGANNIFADEIEMSQSGAAGIKAHTISMQESGAVALKAEDVTMSQSGAVVLQADDVRLQGNVAVVVANHVELEDSAVLAVASQSLRAERIETILLLAGNVEGEVHTVVDTRDAILIGLLGGMISGVFLLMGKFLFRRNK